MFSESIEHDPIASGTKWPNDTACRPRSELQASRLSFLCAIQILDTSNRPTDEFRQEGRADSARNEAQRLRDPRRCRCQRFRVQGICGLFWRQRPLLQRREPCLDRKACPSRDVERSKKQSIPKRITRHDPSNALPCAPKSFAHAEKILDVLRGFRDADRCGCMGLGFGRVAENT